MPPDISGGVLFCDVRAQSPKEMTTPILELEGAMTMNQSEDNKVDGTG
jgi:hypothetical protein